MVDRVLLGNRSGVYGLFVSKAGQSVLSSSDLLMSTSVKNLQVVQRGSFGASFGSPISISWSPLGFRPRVIVQTQHAVRSITYTSNNSANIILDSAQTVLNLEWTSGGSPPTLSNTVYWSVLSAEN